MQKLLIGAVFGMALFVMPGLGFASVTVGEVTSISVCANQARYGADGVLVPASNCTTYAAKKVGDSYVTDAGAVYNSVCTQPPPLPGGGLSMEPAACNYVFSHNDTTATETQSEEATPATGLVPCGGTGQEPCQSCDVVTLANNVISWLVVILGTVAALIIVYAGVKLVTSAGNHHAKEEAKSMMTNLLIGYTIILSGWLLVDYGLKALLSDSSDFGVWNEIKCVDQPKPDEYTEWSNPDSTLTGQSGWATAPSEGDRASSARCEAIGPGEYDCALKIAECTRIHGEPVVSTLGDVVTCKPTQYTVRVTGGGVQCAAGNTACSVSALQAVGMSAVQANVMSCIAMTESSGNPSTPPYNQSHPGSNSSACGTFQVVRTTWNANATGMCSDFSMCMNATCNAQVAATLVKRNGYSDWTCKDCNNKASGCIAKFGG